MEPLSARGLPRLSWIDTLYSSTYPHRPPTTSSSITAHPHASLFTQQLSLPPGSPGLPICLTAVVTHHPLLMYFFPPLFLWTFIWEASLLLSVTLRHPPPPTLWWHPLLSATAAAGCFFSFQGKPEIITQERFMLPSLRWNFMFQPSYVEFLIHSLLW